MEQHTLSKKHMDDEKTETIANPEEALAAKQQYRNELRDGWMLINIASEDPAGYLCVGRRYASQKRRQRALDVFSKGLESVRMCQSDYHCLLQGKMHAQQSL
ncbi:hypothetical protein BDC45DRAFT_542257 [Circinella umbellata]|nr:hypothetical protein BDC45DRAFT_542257 [Circinella umbellata]